VFKDEPMNDIFSQLKFLLNVAWYNIKYEASNNTTLVVGALAVILLIWLFMSPTVRKKG
jgi:hypothetical protein